MNLVPAPPGNALLAGSACCLGCGKLAKTEPPMFAHFDCHESVTSIGGLHLGGVRMQLQR